MLMKVTQRRPLSADIEEFTLESASAEPLPPVEPGAHITVTTPSGANRRYSLVHSGRDLKCYTLAIKREPNSRGGSASMHEKAHVGCEINIEAPENEFPLGNGHAALLIAGGIGITPIYNMAQHLNATGREFRVIYCTRSAEYTAYLKELRALCANKLIVHHDAGNPEHAFDFWSVLGRPTLEHIYCCGPTPLMDEIKAMTGHWKEGSVHFEDFQPLEIVRDDDKPFTLTLAKSGTEIRVPADRTILETLRENGFETSSSCESGTCGTCKYTYLEGDVDHRDMVLMDDEKPNKIMICISRAKGDHLVLDL